jgi:hypothetical protein
MYALAVDSLANHLYQGRFEVRDLLQQVTYSESPNLCTLQMQVPYPFKDDNSANFLKDLTAERFTDDRCYISMNSGLKVPKRRAIRQTYTVRGMDVMLPQGVSIRQAQEEFERYLFKHTQGCERGMLTLPFIEQSNLLPIPFPRSFYSWEDNSYRLS